MANQINVNTESITNILSKLTDFREEIEARIMELQRIVDIAEDEGWNDSSYHEFKDFFQDIRSAILDPVRVIEEEMIPSLKKIMRSAENFGSD